MVIRFGKRSQDNQVARPFLVTFKDKEGLIEINANLTKQISQKDADIKIKSLRVTPDRSFKEREEVRKFVQRAKNLSEQETESFVNLVRGMQIIEVKKEIQTKQNPVIGI